MLVTVGPTDSDRLRQPRDATKDFSKACKVNRFRPAALNKVKSGYPPLAPVPGGTTTPSSTTTYIRPCVRSYLPRASRRQRIRRRHPSIYYLSLDPWTSGLRVGL